MALIDRVITAFDKLITELPTKPNASAGLTAEQLQAWWDSSPEELRLSLNGVINDLVAASGAGQIGFSDPSFLATNVKAAIVEVLVIAQAAQAGTILLGSIGDDKLSNTPGQIKDKVNTLTADLNGLKTEFSTQEGAALLNMYKNIGGAL